MRNIFLLFLFICITGSGWAQLLYPEVMEPRTPLNGPVVNKLTGLSFPPFLYKVRQENRTIENPGVRYAIQNLKKERYPEPQVNEAINTLIRYAEDERLKHVDVYQSPAIEKKHAETNEAGISNRFDDEYFKLNPMLVGQLHRRYWTYYSEVELAMSQGKLANWTSGGENSLSLLSNIRYFWNYNRNNTSWENWVHYRFGFMKNGDEDIRKNEDRFELNSKLGQRAFKHWYYTAQFNVITQLFNSYEYPQDQDKKLVANFMSPGDFTLSLGLDFKPNDRFSLFISPIAGKWNFVRDTAKIDVGRYGVEQGKRARREAGARIDLRSTQNNIFKIMNIRNELTWFMSYEKKDHYLNFESDNEEKKKIPFTVNWKLNIDFNINYFMRASIYTETIYNENNSKKLQFKENLNLGVNFRF